MHKIKLNFVFFSDERVFLHLKISNDFLICCSRWEVSFQMKDPSKSKDVFSWFVFTCKFLRHVSSFKRRLLQRAMFFSKCCFSCFSIKHVLNVCSCFVINQKLFHDQCVFLWTATLALNKLSTDKYWKELSYCNYNVLGWNGGQLAESTIDICVKW